MGPWSLDSLLPTTVLGPGLAWPGLSLPSPEGSKSTQTLSQTLLKSVSADSVKGLRGKKCAGLCGSLLCRPFLQQWLCRKLVLSDSALGPRVDAGWL